ncbi:AAA family ATPase [Halomonas sp. 3H]|uniref:AAA family ATPase n=1 Tax=Halomonas sp. 3H TaxID=2952527 RepID=UPI0020B67C16|nr:AAA family ATPase [Halomonas sp. 3H]
MEIRFIVFTGPKKEPAELNFGSGLNLIYGPSNTGKSSVLDAIDFMLGREDRPIKEIPEHEGYNQLYLGVEFPDSEKYTFVRSIDGGDFECFEGLHKRRPKGQESTVLRPKTETKKIKSISTFILEKLDLYGKKLKKNADNGLVSLTLRNSLSLSIVTETDIQKEASPYISTQYTKKTEHKSRLKFMLTGADDSALLPAEVEKKRLSRTAKIDILEELIAEQEEIIDSVISEEKTIEDLKEQEEKLAETIKNERSVLDANEEQYNLFISDRGRIRGELEKNNERLSEISEMLVRFELLESQYSSDMSRLDNIAETGVLLAALPSDICPLCGGDTAELKSHEGCEGNIGEIVSAASSEKKKLEKLSLDLVDTMKKLRVESGVIEERIPDISEELSSVVRKISDLNPELSSQRARYSELFSIKANVDRSIEQYEQLNALKRKKEELEKEAPEKVGSGKDDTERTLPTSALFKLSKEVKALLKGWSVPNSDDVHFDKETGDFVISGKNRVSNGKGHRAITHAAATLGLMKYTEDNGLPHLGFAIIDSPLLAYEEPENEADDLNGTDVNVRFFDSLCQWKTRQIIVFENKKSIPSKYSSGEQVVEFTKSNAGRYGFFPRISP